MQLADFTLAAFVGLSGVRIFSYVPQIVRVLQDQNGATAISYCTWIMWTLANAATAAYAIVNIGEPYLAAVSSVYALCCLSVIGITVVKRQAHCARGRCRTDARNPVDNADHLRLEIQHSAQRLVSEEASRVLGGMRPSLDFEQRLKARRNMLLRHDAARWFSRAPA